MSANRASAVRAAVPKASYRALKTNSYLFWSIRRPIPCKRCMLGNVIGVNRKAADEAKRAYPTNATLDKATGFQGYEPEGVLTQQPQKSPKVRS